jgi:flagella basal body P-ring formation protein FlgA
MRALLSFCLFTSAFSAAADIGRFIEPIQIAPKVPVPTVRYVVKSSAFVSPHASNPQAQEAAPVADSIVIDRQLMEKRLGEALAHRFQTSGRVSAFLTREWTNCRSSSSFIVKIKDCSPDELTPSTFVRFSIWDQGKELGRYAEPIRMAHFLEVFYSKAPLVRGTRLDSSNLSTRLVDVLKQHAGSVPYQSRLAGYQLDANLKANSPLKWSNLSKVVLVRKGQIVDVFASGNGIYVTMKGMALDDGVEGGVVTVRNLSSDKKFPAKVLNENSVKVHL